MVNRARWRWLASLLAVTSLSVACGSDEPTSGIAESDVGSSGASPDDQIADTDQTGTEQQGEAGGDAYGSEVPSSELMVPLTEADVSFEGTVQVDDNFAGQESSGQLCATADALQVASPAEELARTIVATDLGFPSLAQAVRRHASQEEAAAFVAAEREAALSCDGVAENQSASTITYSIEEIDPPDAYGDHAYAFDLVAQGEPSDGSDQGVSLFGRIGSIQAGTDSYTLIFATADPEELNDFGEFLGLAAARLGY